MQWYGDRVKAEIRREFRGRIREGTKVVARAARAMLSTSARTAARVGRDDRGRFERRTANSSSTPGEPPRKRTGKLRKSVARQVRGLEGRVGTRVFYGRLLERGTRIFAPRPWLGPAAEQSKDELRRILGKPLR